MTEERKYIYSIIRNPPGERQTLDTFRLSEALLGINNCDINFISYRDLVAVVSNLRLINFDKLDKKELTRLIAIHEQVNSRLLEKHDVIPMRFGMIAESAEEIRNILTKAYIQFKAALERIAGKAEFIVQIFWNEKNTLKKIVRENAEIQKLKESAELRGRILGFSAKIKLGKAIFEAIEARRKEYTADILVNLTTHFPDFSVGKLLDANKEGAANETTDREIIMNYSFLVGKTKESALEFQLNELAEKYKDELKFKYIGPMATYSFAVINLEVGNFDLVDNARKTLKLGESATFSEIRDAYYQLAAEHHPDKHGYKNDHLILEETTRKMKEIVAAHEVLTVYCQHYFSILLPEQEQRCSFRQEEVEGSVLIK